MKTQGLGVKRKISALALGRFRPSQTGLPYLVLHGARAPNAPRIPVSKSLVGVKKHAQQAMRPPYNHSTTAVSGNASTQRGGYKAKLLQESRNRGEAFASPRFRPEKIPARGNFPVVATAPSRCLVRSSRWDRRNPRR
jgi:hypothetical protein